MQKNTLRPKKGSLLHELYSRRISYARFDRKSRSEPQFLICGYDMQVFLKPIFLLVNHGRF